MTISILGKKDVLHSGKEKKDSIINETDEKV